MKERELAAYLQQKVENALNEEGGDLSTLRQTNLDFYQGEKYGNEVPGQSSIVTREGFEVVEWAMPSIIRTFTGSRPVEFAPEGPEDETSAEQETDVINHLLFNQENGFTAIHNWVKDCLMFPNGYAKIWVDETQEVVTENYAGLTVEQLTALDSEENVELVAYETETVVTPVGPVDLFDVEVRVTKREPKLRFEAVPGEECLVDNDLTSLDLDEATFVCHRTRRNFTDLVNDGYDPDELRASGDDNHEYSSERTNRHDFEDENPDNQDDDDESVRDYWVEECYVRVDYDGDGLAERRRVVMIGNTIFENEEFDYMPMVAMSSIMMPHKHIGMSLLETVKDLQMASSALMRQLLTNLYRINVPRKYVGRAALEDGTMTMDALEDGRAEIIPVRDPAAIQAETITPLAQHIIPVMQVVGEQKSLRTGINPNVSLDPNVLKESTMGAYTAALDHASQRLEMIVRVMAETGIKTAMRKAHRLIREHMGNDIAVKLRGNWINISPREWSERTNLTVRVGIGTTNKTERLQALAQIMQYQQGLIQAGAHWITPMNLYGTMREMTEAAGIEGVERFFTDPSTIPPPPPPQPDPVMLAQAQALQMDGQSKLTRAQVEQQKLQLEAQRLQFEQIQEGQKQQIQQAEWQLEQREKVANSQGEREKTRAETELKEAQTIKTLEEAKEKRIDNQAAEAGVLDHMEMMVNEQI
jgi:hypothetical protein